MNKSFSFCITLLIAKNIYSNTTMIGNSTIKIIIVRSIIYALAYYDLTTMQIDHAGIGISVLHIFYSMHRRI